MPTYKNLTKVNKYQMKLKSGGIFKSLQNWINGRGFFDKDISTNADERILTG